MDAVLEAGAHAIVADLNRDNLKADECRLQGANVSFKELDVSDANAVEDFAARAGSVSVLINNAGIGGQTAAEDITDDQWRNVMKVNVDGAYWCARSFGKRMIQRGVGSIVNVGSMSGEVIVRPQKHAHYNTSKAAVHHLTRSLAAEWAPYGVRVNAVAPGFIATSMTSYVFEDPDLRSIWLGNVPLARPGQVDEIASIVLFLASEASSFMTGSIVVADGGYTIW